MNKFLMTAIAVLGFSIVSVDSDAASRLGGGKSVGRQRESVAQPARPPAQQAPAAAPATKPQQPQPQPSGMSKWLGPLAGLAIGAGLASLFMGNGLGGGFGSILMMLLLAAAAVFAWRMFRSRTQPHSLQYAGAGEPGRQPDISNAFGGGASAQAAAASRFPPGFDAEQFAHHAKINFTQLQAANDKRDLSAMRDFMTPALYTEIAAELKTRGEAPQQTDVVTLNAEVLEVVTEGDVHVASVRFSGTIRENSSTPPEAFSEVWHLEKPLDGSTGWLISGIQQV